MGMTFGYAELTPESRHFNTSVLVDRSGAIVGKYRKVHLPGHADFDAQRAFLSVDFDALRPVGRLAGNGYARQGDRFEMSRMTYAEWRAKRDGT